MNKILVANRGEIACRIIRTAHALGYATVAVYTPPDKNAPHVRYADQAVALPTPDSYLNIDLIIHSAHKTNADAIHPGYGFLSENAAFAKACDNAGLVFIGPPGSAIETMGSKQASKQLMESAAVPLIPGYHGSTEDDATLTKAATDIPDQLSTSA